MWFYNSAAIFLILAFLLVLTLNMKDLVTFLMRKFGKFPVRLECTIAPTLTTLPPSLEWRRGGPVEEFYHELNKIMTDHVRTMVVGDKPETIELTWQWLLAQYEQFCPAVYRLLTGPDYTGSHELHVRSVLETGVTFYFPDGLPSMLQLQQMRDQAKTRMM